MNTIKDTVGIMYNSHMKAFLQYAEVSLHNGTRVQYKINWCRSPDNALLITKTVFDEFKVAFNANYLHFRPHNPVNTESSK